MGRGKGGEEEQEDNKINGRSTTYTIKSYMAHNLRFQPVHINEPSMRILRLPSNGTTYVFLSSFIDGFTCDHEATSSY